MLSDVGKAAFSEHMRAAIRNGNEETLVEAISDPSYWVETEFYVRNGVQRERRVNARQAAERLGQTEFNTWYVRGLCARLIEEGAERCKVYRAAEPKWEPGTCAIHEDRTFPVRDVYLAHRAAYWPEPGNPEAPAIPFGPGCHHAIRRVG